MPSVKHIALLQFKAETSASQIEECFKVIRGLKENISQVQDYQGGVYSSPEGLNQGFTHGFIMTFASVQDRDAYLVHPVHEQAKAAVLPHVANVIVFDFQS